MLEQNEVFVACYGSLRTGQANFRVNARAGAESIGEGFTKENYNLYRYGGSYFPSVSLEHSSNGKPVRVEVFKTDMDGVEGAYDMLEGHRGNDNPHTFYKRTPIEVVLDSGETVTAWIYHIDEEQDELVESGDWSLYLSEDN